MEVIGIERTLNIFASVESEIKEQFDKDMEKGVADVRDGRVYSADNIEAQMKRDFGI